MAGEEGDASEPSENYNTVLSSEGKDQLSAVKSNDDGKDGMDRGDTGENTSCNSAGSDPVVTVQSLRGAPMKPDSEAESDIVEADNSVQNQSTSKNGLVNGQEPESTASEEVSNCQSAPIRIGAQVDGEPKDGAVHEEVARESDVQNTNGVVTQNKTPMNDSTAVDDGDFGDLDGVASALVAPLPQETEDDDDDDFGDFGDFDDGPSNQVSDAAADDDFGDFDDARDASEPNAQWPLVDPYVEQIRPALTKIFGRFENTNQDGAIWTTNESNEDAVISDVLGQLSESSALAAQLYNAEGLDALLVTVSEAMVQSAKSNFVEKRGLEPPYSKYCKAWTDSDVSKVEYNITLMPPVPEIPPLMSQPEPKPELPVDLLPDEFSYDPDLILAIPPPPQRSISAAFVVAEETEDENVIEIIEELPTTPPKGDDGPADVKLDFTDFKAPKKRFWRRR